MPTFRFVERPPSDPEWKAVHRAADRGIASIRNPFLEEVENLRGRLPSLDDLETIILDSGAGLVGAIDWAQFEAALSAAWLPAFRDTHLRAMRGILGIVEDDVAADVKLVVVSKQEFRAEFGLINPEAVAAAARQAAEAVMEISDATKRSIREIIRRGQLGLLTVDQQARRIRDLIGLTERQTASVLNFEAALVERGIKGAELEKRVLKKYQQTLRQRATTIARTETIKAANLGQQSLWNQAADQGLIDRDTAMKRWITTLDDRACPICIPMDGQLRPLNEPFVSPFNGATAMTPPIHAQCRCAMSLETT